MALGATGFDQADTIGRVLRQAARQQVTGVGRHESEFTLIQERLGPGRKKKFNTLVLEGLDLVLRKRGLPGVAELTGDL